VKILSEISLQLDAGKSTLICRGSLPPGAANVASAAPAVVSIVDPVGNLLNKPDRRAW
jgi:hypothetical protein